MSNDCYLQLSRLGDHYYVRIIIVKTYLLPQNNSLEKLFKLFMDLYFYFLSKLLYRNLPKYFGPKFILIIRTKNSKQNFGPKPDFYEIILVYFCTSQHFPQGYAIITSQKISLGPKFCFEFQVLIIRMTFLYEILRQITVLGNHILLFISINYNRFHTFLSFIII